MDDRTLAAAFQQMTLIPGTILVRFDVNLTEKRQAQALSKDEATDWFRRIVRAESKKPASLGYAAPMILAAGIVSRGGPRLHFHGIAALQPGEEAAFGGVLHRARGAAGKLCQNRQVKIRTVRRAEDARYLLDNAEEAQASGLVKGRTLVVSDDLRGTHHPPGPASKSELTYLYILY